VTHTVSAEIVCLLLMHVATLYGKDLSQVQVGPLRSGLTRTKAKLLTKTRYSVMTTDVQRIRNSRIE
jgi:hypothetical protein